MLIVGLGNPYCGDDAVGLIVARQVRQALAGCAEAELAELPAAPFEVAERIAGRRRVVLIDALVDEHLPVGDLRRLQASECKGQTAMGMHTAGLADALELGRLAGLAPPGQLTVYGIVIRQPLEFCEELSPELEAALPEIVRRIAQEISAEPERAGP